MNLELKLPPPIILLIHLISVYCLNYIKISPKINVIYPKETLIISVFLGLMIAIVGVVSFKRHKTTISPLNPSKSSSLVIPIVCPAICI